MQCKLKFIKDIPISRSISFNEIYGREDIPLSYIYINIENGAIFNTEKFYTCKEYPLGFSSNYKFLIKPLRANINKRIFALKYRLEEVSLLENFIASNEKTVGINDIVSLIKNRSNDVSKNKINWGRKESIKTYKYKEISLIKNLSYNAMHNLKEYHLINLKDADYKKCIEFKRNTNKNSFKVDSFGIHKKWNRDLLKDGELNVYLKEKNLSYSEELNILKNDLTLNIIDRVSLNKEYSNLHKYEYKDIKVRNKIISENIAYAVDIEENEVLKNKDYLMKIDTKKAIKNEDYLIENLEKSLIKNEGFSLDFNRKNLYILAAKIFSQNSKLINVNEEKFYKFRDKELSINANIMLNTILKEVFKYKEYTFKTNTKCIFQEGSIFYKTENKNLFSIEQKDFNLNLRNLEIYNEIAYDKNKVIYNIYPIVRFYKNNKFDIFEEKFLNYSKKELDFKISEIYKYDLLETDIVVRDNMKKLTRVDPVIYIDNALLMCGKNSKLTNHRDIINYIKNLKDVKEMDILNVYRTDSFKTRISDILIFQKASKNLFYKEIINFNIKNKSLFYRDIKTYNKKKASLYANEGFINYLKTYNFLFGKEYEAYSKKENSVTEEDIFIKVNKYSNDLFRKDFTNFNIKEKNVYLTDITFANKIYKKVSIANERIDLKKFKTVDIIESLIEANIGEKDIDESYVLIKYNKGEIKINVEDDILFDNIPIIVEINDGIIYQKFNKDILVSMEEMLGKYNKEIYLNKDILFEAREQNIYIEENLITDFKKSKKDTFANKDISLLKALKEVYINSNKFLSKIEKTIEETIEENYKISKIEKVVTKKDLLESLEKVEKDFAKDEEEISLFRVNKIIEIYPSIKRLVTDKDLREVYIEEGKTWLYGDPILPDIRNGGIDELLLPGEDYNYKSLEDKVIDSKGKPINPIEIINDKTFVTNVPLEHPLDKYKNIGMKYIDVDVNLLRHIIDIMYKLWIKKAFKFGASDMKEAINILVEDIIAFIDLTIDDIKKEEAMRIVRLIRWYGEAATIKNAQYVVEVEYEPLRSDFFEGNCKIPHTFNNMHIDMNTLMLTNSNTGIASEAIFYIENPVNTKVSYVIQVTKGEAYVYLNDKLINTVRNGVHKLEIELPYEGKINNFKITYYGNNGIINLSNIVISEMIYENYKLSYKPIRGTGNKVMDELIKYLTTYSDILGANEEYIEKVKDNNYAITELIDNMLDYFEIHHNKKNKGKRITIKK